jgi:hypothetical protein
MLCQPDWHDLRNFEVLGRPRLGVLISAAATWIPCSAIIRRLRKPRREDKYSPGKAMGLRPDHATVVYARKAKELWPDLPVVIGGIEASSAAFCPLRLLGRQAPAFHPGGQRRRRAGVRHGRETGAGDRGLSGRRCPLAPTCSILTGLPI